MRTPPPTFDPAVYRASDPALADLDDAAALDHYREHGREKGIVASPLALRENLLAFIDDDCSILEIGPFHSPLKRGPNVEYLDVLDAEQLRKRASTTRGNPAGVPDIIHHVGGLERVDRRYDAVLSSHAIEHQPDLVRHLQQVEHILHPGGSYFLIIPDKRYCFDHFIADSTIADVLAAYREERSAHTLKSVIEHRALTTHNESLRHWQGDHGDPERRRAARVQAALDEYDRAAGGYVDVHAWYFTPPGFRSIVNTLSELGLIGLEIAGLYHPAFGRNEFCAILRRPE
ncbi:class I SAM-dependent methyltransferase [Sphingomonas crusticola]|uniref:class I SAM-dependent methyltransferase n=1 Tax=Sphingomonas crusticola TaxID=1697973 RepID=UPI0019675BD7|nr:methyltransferase domain-containing protein [Sphingomonas crusticola]